MLLMIDNYDSFTYNLVQYLGELGQDLKVYRNNKITVAEIEKMKPDRIVVSPGPCTPKEAGISIDVIKHFAGKIPRPGRLPGPSVHRRGLRRGRDPGALPDARQDLDDPSRRQDHLLRACPIPSKPPGTIRSS